MIIKVFNNSQDKPEQYSFKETSVVIGRNPGTDNSISINSHTISRKHLVAKINQSEIKVQDLNSSNGTFINGELIQSDKWYKIEKGDLIKLAEFEGHVLFEPRFENVQANKVITKQKAPKSQSDDDSESRQRSREKKIELPFKISDSTFRMLKDMTLNKKSKEQRIKFLKLMGIGKAGEYWEQIEIMLKQKKGIKDKQQTNDELQRQFSRGRSNMEKKGLGM